jgi:hypothetical protein
LGPNSLYFIGAKTETEPSERSQTHHHTPHGFPDKQIKHCDCATTVVLTEFQISMAKAASNNNNNNNEKKEKKRRRRRRRRRRDFAPGNWTYI